MLIILFQILSYQEILNRVHGNGSFMGPLQLITNNTQNSSTTMLNNTFLCRGKPTVLITQFELNVTLSSPDVLTNATPGELIGSADTNRWHFVVDRYYDFNIYYGYVDVKFTLTYQNTTLDGNCSFAFPDGQITSGSINVTTSTSFISQLSSSFVAITDYTSYISTTTATASFQFTETSIFPFTEFTTTVVTDRPPENTSQNSMCRCPCECVSPMPQYQADEMLTVILESLQITKSVTSSSKRKLISAPDDRVSSQSIGFVGAFVISVVFGIIIIGDAHRLFSNMKTTLTRLKGNWATRDNLSDMS